MDLKGRFSLCSSGWMSPVMGRGPGDGGAGVPPALGEAEAPGWARSGPGLSRPLEATVLCCGSTVAPAPRQREDQRGAFYLWQVGLKRIPPGDLGAQDTRLL